MTSSSYEYSYTSSSKDAGDTAAGEIFAAADTNNDGVIDRAEFENLVGAHSGETGGYKTSYKTTSYSSGGDAALVGRTGRSSYELAGYTSGVRGSSRGGYRTSTYESSSGYDSSEIAQAAAYTADSNPAWSRFGAEVRGVGLYVDPNPQIIRREVPGGTQTYTQTIRVRFLQPPPVQTSGTLIVKEVRAAQPPPLPPLRIRQEEVAVAQPPPLILRERPPIPPAPLPTETVIRHLPALPVPPRSVIIERYRAATARPRDIIIERWLPYQTIGERKTIVQRAEEVASYPAPRNVIIEYEQAHVRVVRQFQNLGVVHENPDAYIARYGAELLDTETLIRQARAAGVVEDISTPAAIASSGVSALAYSTDTTYGVGDAGTTGYSYSYKSSGLGGHGHLHGGLTGTIYDEGNTGGYTTTYKTTSYSSGGLSSSDVVSGGFNTIEASL